MSKEKKTCNRCNGSGEITCPGCGGSGKLERIDESTRQGSRIVSCAGCHGSGKRTCGACGGSGQGKDTTIAYNEIFKNNHNHYTYKPQF